jgi:type IV secretory pathway TraG/TraD family ATPase VirD4
MLFLQRLRNATFSRGNVPAAQRRPFTLAIDEFQKFLGSTGFGYTGNTRTLAPMLDECRKFGVALVLANQYVAQLDDRTRDAILGNVGSMVAFRSGAADAALIAEELGGGTSAEELRGMPLFHALARVLVDGQATPVFTLRTTP